MRSSYQYSIHERYSRYGNPPTLYTPVIHSCMCCYKILIVFWANRFKPGVYRIYAFVPVAINSLILFKLPTEYLCFPSLTNKPLIELFSIQNISDTFLRFVLFRFKITNKQTNWI